MLERQYDPTLPYRYACYGRMSDPRQNKRSPEQQFNTIDETIARAGYPWRCVATYRDDGISGRYLRKRLGFQRLLRDIEVGLIQVDLIVVDTLERLGRADEIAELRRRLFIEQGVLIVAADIGFSDPTGIVGKAVGMVEQIRSTENTRISRHNVIRGKKDAARRHRWPGGPIPFGYRLKQVIDHACAPPEVYNVLEPEPRQAAALRLAFERAAATDDGDLRLSQWWNRSAEIPEEFKPISPFTMGHRFDNPIVIGTLRWGEHRTGIVNDSRVIEPNPDGAELVAEFCPPIVSVELYQRVQQLRRLRAEQIKASRNARGQGGAETVKLIAPQTRGLALKYLLSGLLRCGCCNASLRPVPSGRRSKGGRRYVYYTCPRHYDGACINGRHVPEDGLREAVLARVRSRLFPWNGTAGPAHAWLAELMEMVRQEQQRLRTEEPDRQLLDQEELNRLEQQLAGWLLTLGNPQLPGPVRADIEARFAQGKQRQQELQESIAARAALPDRTEATPGAQEAMTALRDLAEVLAGHNPTLGNRELSKHIAGIFCYPDGRVEMRGTMPGLFAGAVEILSHGTQDGCLRPPDGGAYPPIVPRRRGPLRLSNLPIPDTPRTDARDGTWKAEELAGLAESSCWSEPMLLEESRSWSERHAVAVARLRVTGRTHEQLAAHFQVSVPTIRKALRLAAAADPDLTGPAKMPRRRWAEDHAETVVRLRQEGLPIQEIARRLGKSEPTIRAALEHARREGEEGLPDKGT